jgi:hypothetical protein
MQSFKQALLLFNSGAHFLLRITSRRRLYLRRLPPVGSACAALQNIPHILQFVKQIISPPPLSLFLYCNLYSSTVKHYCMLHIHHKRLGFKLLALAASFMTLSAFTGNMGGDSFTIYLNDKLLLKEYVYGAQGIKNLQLDQRSYNDQLNIYYNHCGQTGTDRSIILKDGQNRILKEWHFPDATGANTAMTCRVKDILDLQKGGGAINLYYTSRELRNGRLLASIQAAGDSKQALDKRPAPQAKS